MSGVCRSTIATPVVASSHRWAERGPVSARTATRVEKPTLELPPAEVVVMVRRDLGLRATNDGLMVTAAANTETMTDLIQSHGAALRPLFGVREDRLARAAAEPSAFGVPVPDLSVYYRAEAPHGGLEALAADLASHELVEAAYVKPPAEPAVYNDMAPAAEDAPPTSPDFTARQGYLDAAPGGIDARYGWTVAGGSGAGVRIVDVEGAWRFSHEDLLQNQGGVIGGVPSTDPGWWNHGTGVVGEFGGDRNPFGVTGIAPDANVRAISIFGGPGSAGALRLAADALGPGDVILIELHRPGPRNAFAGRADQMGYIAIEWWPDDFDAIRYAIGRGVIVVEAAGNGAEDLDDPIYQNPATGFPASWTNPFNRSNRDSGAIVVGAGAPPTGTHGRDHGPDRSRLGFSNFGALIDAQGWGREVTTTGYGDLQGGTNPDLWYTDQFSGTSSASPIVVGAVAALQGIARARGTVLTSAQMRQYLRATGSPQQDAPTRPATQRIGNRPDLRGLVSTAFKPLKAEIKEKSEKAEKVEKVEVKELKREIKEKREKVEFKEFKELKREKLERKELKEKEFKEGKLEVEGKLRDHKFEVEGQKLQEFQRQGRGIPDSAEPDISELGSKRDSALQRATEPRRRSARRHPSP